MSCPSSFFFGGGCWLACYHIGVYKGMLEKWGDIIYEKKIGGNSAGAIIALGVVLKKSVDEISEAYELSVNYSKKNGIFSNSSCHSLLINKWLDDKDIYKKLNKKLHIGITYFFSKFTIINEFNSNQDVIDALHASMHIPYYCSYIKRVNGKIAIDGGFSKNISKLDEDTFTISLFRKNASLYPSKQFKWQEIILPIKKNKCKEIIDIGYNDILNCNNLTNNKQTNYKNPENSNIIKFVIALAWTMRISEYFVYNHKNKLLLVFIIINISKFLNVKTLTKFMQTKLVHF